MIDMTWAYGFKIAGAGMLTAGAAAITVPEHVPLVAISGVMGGVLRWLYDETHIWPGGFKAMLSGAIIATFFWPIGQPLTEEFTGNLGMEPIPAMMFGGCVTGLLGMSIIGGVLDIFNARKKRIERDEK